LANVLCSLLRRLANFSELRFDVFPIPFELIPEIPRLELTQVHLHPQLVAHRAEFLSLFMDPISQRHVL
jgi:hypothetical protein